MHISDKQCLVVEDGGGHTRGKTKNTSISLCFYRPNPVLTVWESVQNTSQELLRGLADELRIFVFRTSAATVSF